MSVEENVVGKGMVNKVTYFAVCPMCGYKLLKGAEGTQVEMICPKCHDEVLVTINKEFVQTSKGRTRTKADK